MDREMDEGENCEELQIRKEVVSVRAVAIVFVGGCDLFKTQTNC